MNDPKNRLQYNTPSSEAVDLAVSDSFLNISVILDPMDLILLDLDPEYEWDETLVDRALL